MKHHRDKGSGDLKTMSMSSRLKESPSLYTGQTFISKRTDLSKMDKNHGPMYRQGIKGQEVVHVIRFTGSRTRV